LRNILFSEGLPVIKGDRISLSFDYRVDFSSTGATMQVATIFIIPEGGGAKKYVSNTGTAFTGPFVWQEDSSLEMVSIAFTGQNINEWTSISIEPNEIPVNGTLYIGLSTIDLNARFFFKNVNVDYRLFIAGGYIQVKGDYWERTQTKSIQDVS